MAREADVVRSLVEMAGTLVDDFDVIDLLTGLADRCVSLLGVSAAGVMLASPAGRLGLAASSSEAMRLLELFELQAEEGPCLDAFRTGERVGPEGLEAGAGHWPSFSAAAVDAGFWSACALPLRLRDVTLGALNLLSVDPAAVTEPDIIVARAFADLAALSIVQHRVSIEAQHLNEQLTDALTSRVVIEQAKGVIAERAGTGLAEAFSRLRAYARNHNLRLTDVAQAAIDGTLDPLAWAPPPRPGSPRPGSPRARRARPGWARPGRARPAASEPGLAGIILRVGEEMQEYRYSVRQAALAAGWSPRHRDVSGGWLTRLVTAGCILLAAGCASSSPPSGPPPAAQSPALAARYLAIARPANHQLDHEFDDLKDHEKSDLAAARADLRAAAATERRFDRQLIAITFPPPTEPIVRLLYRVNQARAALTSTAAVATSLRQLRGYQRRLDAANAPVEDAVRVIRDQLGLPPPDTS